ncbi:hypothetical protein [Oceaniferula spumae]
MKTHLLVITLMFSALGHLPAQILESKVPWTGTARNTTLREFLPRIQGWSEGQGKKTISYIYMGIISDQIFDKQIRVRIPAEDKPSYEDVIRLAFERAGMKVALKDSDRGIEVTPIYSRILKLNDDTLKRLRASKIETTDGISKKVKSRVGDLSNHFWLRYMDDGVLSFGGTNEDITKVARFFAKYE